MEADEGMPWIILGSVNFTDALEQNNNMSNHTHDDEDSTFVPETNDEIDYTD